MKSIHSSCQYGCTALSVNVNKVALVRNTRSLGIPGVMRAAQLCLEAGAQGITVHPRPDERHIRTQDVYDLAQILKNWTGREYNIEGNPLHNLMFFIENVRPHQATFVPDTVNQSTSDHGWDLDTQGEALRPLIMRCKELGVRVSLFMDAQPQLMAKAKALGADRVELYTEPWARAFGKPEQATVLENFINTAKVANDLGLAVNAGHDLNQLNLTPFLKNVPYVKEVSIGHALISDALEEGYRQTVCNYLRCIVNAYQST